MKTEDTLTDQQREWEQMQRAKAQLCMCGHRYDRHTVAWQNPGCMMFGCDCHKFVPGRSFDHVR